MNVVQVETESTDVRKGRASISFDAGTSKAPLTRISERRGKITPDFFAFGILIYGTILCST